LAGKRNYCLGGGTGTRQERRTEGREQQSQWRKEKKNQNNFWNIEGKREWARTRIKEGKGGKAKESIGVRKEGNSEKKGYCMDTTRERKKKGE
jgi:hypothetical protein